MKMFRFSLLLLMAVAITTTGCGQNPKQSATVLNNKVSKPASAAQNFKEGADYFLFERARIVDAVGLERPGEAFSILLPKGWRQQSGITWVAPGNACAGTYRWLKASSPDGKSELEFYPDILFSWNTNPALMQFNQNNSSSSNCFTAQPMNAEEYLRNQFAQRELGGAEIIKVEPNQLVVAQMQQSNQKTRAELMKYGSAGIQFNQTAVNARVRFSDGRKALVVLGVTVIENTVPNVYNGTYDKSYTTMVTQRTVYKYPETHAAFAEDHFSLIMGSFRTNPAWNTAVNNFWKDVREQRHVAHVGAIKFMDAQTEAIGKRAIKAGNDRLQAMDGEMRSWEQRQNSQDRIHTNFIKTIREVENYRDETGKVELSSAYNHAWSRSDGSSFVMSNNPNLDPAAIFQDQRWKQMKKVD
jgi:hypothetical protein